MYLRERGLPCQDRAVRAYRAKHFLHPPALDVTLGALVEDGEVNELECLDVWEKASSRHLS